MKATLALLLAASGLGGGALVALNTQENTVDTGRILTVAGQSMTPTLNPGEQVRLNQRTGDAATHGDLVAIKLKTREQMMVKRVIAVAGDRVEFSEGRPRINGAWPDSAWWPEERRLQPRAYHILALQLSRYDNKVPKDNVIVMGDNTRNSFDSGDFGMVATHQIRGTVEKLN